MRTSGLDTSSLCRTTGGVTKSVCLVGGILPAQPHVGEVIYHVTVRILPRRLYSSGFGRVSVQSEHRIQIDPG